MPENITRAVNILKILASRTRFKIIKLLMQTNRDLCVGEIAKTIGMTQSATSHQLAKLERKGVVKSFRMGKEVCYEIERSAITGELLNIIEQFS